MVMPQKPSFSCGWAVASSASKAYWKDAREDVQTRTAEARERWNGMREELRETAQERSAEWKARHDSDPKE